MELFTNTNRILSRLNALERTIGDVADRLYHSTALLEYKAEQTMSRTIF